MIFKYLLWFILLKISCNKYATYNNKENFQDWQKYVKLSIKTIKLLVTTSMVCFNYENIVIYILSKRECNGERSLWGLNHGSSKLQLLAVTIVRFSIKKRESVNIYFYRCNYSGVVITD